MTDEARQREMHRLRQQAHHQRKRAAGLVRVSAWIPKTERKAFWDAYDRLVEEWRRSGQWRDS